MSHPLSLILERVVSRTLRPFFRGSFQSKRISQGFFSNICLSIQREAKNARVAYIKSDLLASSFQLISESQPLVVFAGSSDHDISSDEYNMMLSLTHTKFFVQNLDFPETQSVKVLPIGIEDPLWARNGMSWNFRGSLTQSSKENRILVGPFGSTHEDRSLLIEAAKTIGHVDVITERLPNWSYSKLAATYRFIACPRGNGLDTHRFWESLYRGSIPVVLASHWSSNLRKNGVPLIELDSWAALQDACLDTTFEQKVDQISFLDPGWWEKQLRKDLSLD